MTPQRINDYFDKLIARAEEASHLPYVAFVEGNPHECHKNADTHAARHPDHQPVHAIRHSHQRQQECEAQTKALVISAIVSHALQCGSGDSGRKVLLLSP